MRQLQPPLHLVPQDPPEAAPGGDAGPSGAGTISGDDMRSGEAGSRVAAGATTRPAGPAGAV